jgi:hypothetical protein
MFCSVKSFCIGLGYVLMFINMVNFIYLGFSLFFLQFVFIFLGLCLYLCKDCLIGEV